jgi:hypothetical protein
MIPSRRALRHAIDNNIPLHAKSSNFQQKFKQFRGEINKNKSDSKLSSHKFQWKLEFQQLQKQYKQLLNELNNLINNGSDDEIFEELGREQNQIEFNCISAATEIKANIQSIQTLKKSTKQTKTTPQLMNVRRLILQSSNMYSNDLISLRELELQLNNQMVGYNSVWLDQFTKIPIDEKEAQETPNAVQAQSKPLVSVEREEESSYEELDENNMPIEANFAINNDDNALYDDKYANNNTTNTSAKHAVRAASASSKYPQIFSLTELESLVSQNSSSAQHSIDQYCLELDLLNADYRSKLTQISAEFNSFVASLGLNSADWPVSSEERLKHIYSNYSRQNLPISAILERLMLEFPRFPRQFLSLRIELYCKFFHFKTRRKLLISSWESKKVALNSKINAEIGATKAKERENLKKEQEIMELQQKQAINHTKLAVWRAEKLENQQIHAESTAKQQLLAESAAEQRRKRLAEYQTEQKQLICQWKWQLERWKESAEEENRRILAEEAQNKMQRAEVDAERIEFRANLLKQRQIARISAELERKEAELARWERLEALRSTVVVIAEADSARLMSATASTAAEKHKLTEFFPVHGYNLADLMADKRFELSTALHAAGLGGNTYARSMIAQAAAAHKPRKDTQSTIFQ